MPPFSFFSYGLIDSFILFSLLISKFEKVPIDLSFSISFTFQKKQNCLVVLSEEPGAPPEKGETEKKRYIDFSVVLCATSSNDSGFVILTSSYII